MSSLRRTNRTKEERWDRRADQSGSRSTSALRDRGLPRVLQIGKFYPPFRGGMESHLQTLAEGISPHVNLTVLVANTSRESVEEQNGSVIVHRLGRHLSVLRAPICFGLPAALRKFRPDLVHIHLPNPAAVMSVLASGYRGPMVATYHNDLVRKKILVGVLEPMVRMLLRRCTAVIATSRNYASTSPTLRAFADRCRVIHPGIEPRHFSHGNPQRVSAIRARYGDRIVIAVGRLIYYKGFEYLIEAMKAVDAHLVIVGEGPLRPALMKRAEKAETAARVTFTGELGHDEMVDHLHAAAVFVLPSCARSEAFGIVQLEAMAAGLPVINTNLDSGVPSVSLHGRTGLTVEPRSASALAAAINELLADPPRAHALGEAGRRRVNDVFTAAQMCETTLSLYRSIGIPHVEPEPELLPAQSG